MRFSDMIRMAIHNLVSRRLRTALILIGIVIGCTMLLMTAAGGAGVSVALHGLLNSSDYARQISIYSDRGSGVQVPEEVTTVDGEMSDERRERLSESLADQWREDNIPWTARQLSAEVLERLERVPHVTEVVPGYWLHGVVDGGNVSILTSVEGCSASDRDLADRVIAGSNLSSNKDNEILLSEFLAYRLGYRSDRELNALIGREIRFTLGTAGMQLGGFFWSMNQGGTFDADAFQKQLQLAAAVAALMDDLDATSLNDEQKDLLSEAMAALRDQPLGKLPDDGSRGTADRESDADTAVAMTEVFRVVGVIRPPAHDDSWALFRQSIHGGGGDALVGFQTAQRLLAMKGDDLSSYEARVTVTSTEHLADCVAQIEAEDVRTVSALKILERVDREIDRITWAIYGIAGGILFVACLGISNTLIISVIERTPEFGIMKSLGAQDSSILLLTITEGAFLGAVGAAISLVVSWLLALIGDGILRSYVESQVADEIQSGLFHFSPLWIAGVTVVSIVVCMLASLLPAFRASRLDPVVAMRRT